MHCQVAFSQQTFARLIRFRLADQFRPLAQPVEFPAGKQNWLDGFVVTGVVLTGISQHRIVTLNRVAVTGDVEPVSNGTGFWSSAVVVDLTARVHLAEVGAVATAGLAVPPVTAVDIPNGVLVVTVRLDVDNKGVAVLSMQLDTSKLAALGLPPAAISGLAGATNVSMPLDIAAALRDLMPAGSAKVLNAAIALGANDAVVMRFELAAGVDPGTYARAAAWREFCEVDPHPDLGSLDWCVSIDGSAMAEAMATSLNPLIKSAHPVYFDETWVDWSFLESHFEGLALVPGPRVVVKKKGHVANACAGIDVRFDAYINVDFSVPTENMLRALLSFDYSKNGGDAAKCVALTLSNPLSLMITLFDQKQPGLGLGALALDLVFPVRPVAVLAALALMAAGVDSALAQKLVDDKLKEVPALTNVGDRYALDQKVALNNQLTRDWLVLTDVSAAAGQLLLRGVSRIPVARLPKLGAENLEGFSVWRLRDRCEPGRGTETVASVQLKRLPGYVDESEPPVAFPTVPVKFGVRADGSTVMYQILNDPLGIFSDTFGNEYNPIRFGGTIPGELGAVLRSQHVLTARYAQYRTNPYPLRIRMFTNGGVREYEFPPPPPVAPYVETTAQAAARISQCKALSVDPLHQRLLRLRWLVDPEPVGIRYWQVHLRGLRAGERAALLDADGNTLAQMFGNSDGHAEIALLLPPESGAASVSLDEAVGPVDVIVRQVACSPLDVVEFGEAVTDASLVVESDHLELCARTQDGRQLTRLITQPELVGLARQDGGVDTRAPARLVTWRGGQRRFAVLDATSDRADIVAEYAAPSALDRTASVGVLLAQADDAGTVTFYRCGHEVLVAGPQWDADSTVAP